MLAQVGRGEQPRVNANVRGAAGAGRSARPQHRLNKSEPLHGSDCTTAGAKWH